MELMRVAAFKAGTSFWKQEDRVVITRKKSIKIANSILALFAMFLGFGNTLNKTRSAVVVSRLMVKRAKIR